MSPQIKLAPALLPVREKSTVHELFFCTICGESVDGSFAARAVHICHKLTCPMCPLEMHSLAFLEKHINAFHSEKCATLDFSTSICLPDTYEVMFRQSAYAEACASLWVVNLTRAVGHTPVEEDVIIIDDDLPPHPHTPPPPLAASAPPPLARKPKPVRKPIGRVRPFSIPPIPPHQVLAPTYPLLHVPYFLPRFVNFTTAAHSATHLPRPRPMSAPMHKEVSRRRLRTEPREISSDDFMRDTRAALDAIAAAAATADAIAAAAAADALSKLSTQ